MSVVHTVLATVAGVERLSIKVLENYDFLGLLHQHFDTVHVTLSSTDGSNLKENAGNRRAYFKT